MARPSKGVVHGTINGYIRYACRCDLCRAVNAKRARQQRKIYRERNPKQKTIHSKKLSCPVCGDMFAEGSTKKNKARSTGFDSYCRRCDIDYRRKHRSKHPAAGFKAIDKKRGYENDLTDEFVFEMYSKPCLYCGSAVSMMTLDRIDHSKGHTRDNVSSSCRMCNHVRRNMPYEAWILFSPVLRRIEAEGLFGDWNPTPNSIKLRK